MTPKFCLSLMVGVVERRLLSWMECEVFLHKFLGTFVEFIIVNFKYYKKVLFSPVRYIWSQLSPPILLKSIMEYQQL